MIHLIADISNALGKIEHLQDSPQAPRLRKISQIKTITGTLQIEGNTLDEQQITAVLEKVNQYWVLCVILPRLRGR